MKRAAVLLSLFALWPVGSAFADTISDQLILNGKLYSLTEGDEANGLSITAGQTRVPTPNAVVVLTDSDGSSDVLTYNSFSHLFTFSSAYKGSLDIAPGLPGVTYLTETNGFQNVGQYFGLTPSALQVNSLAPTPLPPAWSLMLVGLAGLGFIFHRRGRTQAAAGVATA